MNIELRPEGTLSSRQKERSLHTVEVATNRFADRIRLIRLRLVDGDGMAEARARVWCGPGDTIVVRREAATLQEAVHELGATLNRSLRRRWATRRDIRRRDTFEPAVAAPGLV